MQYFFFLTVENIQHHIIYTYFEKGCRKKCSRQSRKVLWVVLSALFFKEIWKNGTGCLGCYVCDCWRKATKVSSTATVVRNSVLIISHITFRDCRVHIFSDNLSRNNCVYLLEILNFDNIVKFKTAVFTHKIFKFSSYVLWLYTLS